MGVGAEPQTRTVAETRRVRETKVTKQDIVDVTHKRDVFDNSVYNDH